MALAHIQQRMENLADWGLEGGTTIMKEYAFEQFSSSMNFVTKVAELAEQHHHYPSILIDYSTVRITLTTPEEGGLSTKDFDLAEAIDRIGK